MRFRQAVVAAVLALSGSVTPATAAGCAPGEIGEPPNCFAFGDCGPGYEGWVLYWNGVPVARNCAPEDPGPGCGLGCQADSKVCPVLAMLAPSSVPGVIEFGVDGDITLAGEPFWDCPPYEIWTTPAG